VICIERSPHQTQDTQTTATDGTTSGEIVKKQISDYGINVVRLLGKITINHTVPRPLACPAGFLLSESFSV
jgi:hypothetical protein